MTPHAVWKSRGANHNQEQTLVCTGVRGFSVVLCRVHSERGDIIGPLGEKWLGLKKAREGGRRRLFRREDTPLWEHSRESVSKVLSHFKEEKVASVWNNRWLTITWQENNVVLEYAGTQGVLCKLGLQLSVGLRTARWKNRMWRFITKNPESRTTV